MVLGGSAHADPLSDCLEERRNRSGAEARSQYIATNHLPPTNISRSVPSISSTCYNS